MFEAAVVLTGNNRRPRIKRSGGVAYLGERHAHGVENHPGGKLAWQTKVVGLVLHAAFALTGGYRVVALQPLPAIPRQRRLVPGSP